MAPDALRTGRLAARTRPVIPIVDAGMRELWHTGCDAQPRPHGGGLVPDQASADRLARRARPGSGTRWWTPIPASNAGELAVGRGLRSGCGALLPDLQSGAAEVKFDPDGAYVGKWVPELAQLPPGTDPSTVDRHAAGTSQRRRHARQDPIPSRSSITQRRAHAHLPPTPRHAPRLASRFDRRSPNPRSCAGHRKFLSCCHA